MPPDHGLGPHDVKHVAPAADEAPKEDPKHAVGVFEPGARDAALQHKDLLAEDCVLDGETIAVRGGRDEQRDQVTEDFHRLRLPGSGH